MGFEDDFAAAIAALAGTTVAETSKKPVTLPSSQQAVKTETKAEIKPVVVSSIAVEVVLPATEEEYVSIDVYLKRNPELVNTSVAKAIKYIRDNAAVIDELEPYRKMSESQTGWQFRVCPRLYTSMYELMSARGFLKPVTYVKKAEEIENRFSLRFPLNLSRSREGQLEQAVAKLANLDYTSIFVEYKGPLHIARILGIPDSFVLKNEELLLVQLDHSGGRQRYCPDKLADLLALYKGGK